MLWRFDRVVRNALVHNGCIHFTSSASPAVEWSGLRYGFGRNGRPVLFKELTGVGPYPPGWVATGGLGLSPIAMLDPLHDRRHGASGR
jgi:hypothetical protein